MGQITAKKKIDEIEKLCFITFPLYEDRRNYLMEIYSQRDMEEAVLDVATDLSKESETYGNWYGIKLSEENKEQFLIPRDIEQEGSG